MQRSPIDRRLLLILLLSFLVYSPALLNGFTYDDTRYAKSKNPGAPPNLMVAEVQPFSEYFVRPMGWDGTRENGRGFRPITVYSYALVHWLTKDRSPAEPSGDPDRAWLQHLLNVLAHVLGVWLVYLMIHHLTGPGWPALLGSLAFAVQPLHSDVVASIIGRGELLPFVFCGSATLLYAKASRRGASGTLAASALLMLLGLCSKESAVTWLFFAPLYTLAADRMRDPSTSSKDAFRAQVSKLWAVLVPALVFTVLYLNFLGCLQEEFQLNYEYNPLFDLDLVERLPTAVMVFGYGVAKMFFSTMFAADYGLAVFRTDLGWGDGGFLLGLAALLLVLGLGLLSWQHRPLILLGTAAMLGFGFVTSNIPITIETIFGERLLFTPSLGICFWVAWVTGKPKAGSIRKTLIGLFIAWCAWGAYWCIQRSSDWRDNATLMAADVIHQPRSLSIIQQFALTHKATNPARWLEYMHRCLELDEYYVLVRNDLAVHHMQRKELDEAARHLDMALEGLRRYPQYRLTHGDSVHLNQGRLHMVRGELTAACQSFVEARSINRYNPHVRSHLLWIAHTAKDEALADSLLADFQAYQSSDPAIGLHLGLKAYRRGDYQQAQARIADAIFRQRARVQGLEAAPAWFALQDSLRRLGRIPEERQVLDAMTRALPASLQAQVRAKLRELPR